MGSVRPCGCKGCRTCLLCEDLLGIEKKDFYSKYKDYNSYVYCPDCNRIFKGWDIENMAKDHSNHNLNDSLPFPGVLVYENFLTPTEGDDLITKLDEMPWQGSQSGRRKQNFGPKTNFKKKKLQAGEFDGFPKFSKFVQEKFKTVPTLKDFQTIEQCSLEYEPTKGACIDPHIDDCWIWGERVVTVNCLGNSVLTLVKYKKGDDLAKYNLDLVESYRSTLLSDLLNDEQMKLYDDIVIRIPMPNRSLIVMYGPARYQFEHSVLREDIETRRVCVAYREFTPMYLERGDDFEKGKVVTERAQCFWDHVNREINKTDENK